MINLAFLVVPLDKPRHPSPRISPLPTRIILEDTGVTNVFVNIVLNSVIYIDVWDGASGLSADAPRLGLKSNLSSQLQGKNWLKHKKIKYFT